MPFASSSPMFTGNNTPIFPHIFVWGSCSWFCIPACPVPVLSSRRLPHTHNLSTRNLLTRNLSAHNLLTHTTYSHTTSSHTSCPTQLAHTQLTLTQLTTYSCLTNTTCPHNLSTHNLLTHNLLTHNLPSHYLLTHTHTTYSHTSCLTHNLSTHNSSTHSLPTHTQLTHTQLTLTQLTRTQLTLTLLVPTHTHNLLTHNLPIQLTHTHTTFPHTQQTTCSHTTNNLLTHNLLSHGRRGTWWHGPPLGVAGVALGDIDVHSAWQAWHLRHWAGAGGALGAWFALGAAAVCVAGVALGDIDLHLAWQAWRLATSACTLSDIDLHLETSSCTLRGRRGTCGTGLALVARFVFSGRRCRRGCLRGRRGTWQHWPPLCVARVALGNMDLHGWLWWRAWFPVAVHSAWQAWHCTGLALVARLVPSGRRCRCGCLPGRRGRRCVCATPWSLSRCAVAVSLHLPGDWLPADIEVGMSTPDALSAHQPSRSFCRTCNPEQESVTLPDEQRLPRGTLGCVASLCPAWIDFGGWNGS